MATRVRDCAAPRSAVPESTRPRPTRTGEAGPCVVNLERASEHCALDLGDGLRDLDATRAGLGAVEGRAATPHAFLVVEDLQSLIPGHIARVEDEAVSVHDRSRTEVLPVRPEHGA